MRYSPPVSLVIALFVAVLFAHGQESRKPELPEIQALWATHEAAQKTVAAERDKKLANLDYIYRLNVDKPQKDRAAVGDLDGALAAKAELDRLRAHQALTDEQRKAMSPELGKLRAAYDAALNGYRAEAAKQNAALLQKLLADLEALQTRITTTSDLDKALQVKAEKERIAAEGTKPQSAVVSPPAVVAPVPAPEDVKLQPNSPVGTWRFQVAGRSYLRTFHADGTITGDGFSGAGTWRISGSKILIDYPKKGQGSLELPLDPKGTLGRAHDGMKLTAVRESP